MFESTAILTASTKAFRWVSTFQRELVKVHMQIIRIMCFVADKNWISKFGASAVEDEVWYMQKYSLSITQNE